VQYVVAVVVGLGLAEVATLITTIYLHRVLSHKSIRLHPALTMFMRLGTWMLTSISPREWVAVHRKHHNFSDVEGDPHSPHIEGYWQIMLANVYYYRREANNDDTLQKYAADLPFDRLDTALFRRGTLGFGLTGLILVVVMGLGPGLVGLWPRRSSLRSAGSSIRRGPSSGCWWPSGWRRCSARSTRGGRTTAAASPGPS
jgi:stearoyl-CoA desaturase (delta-9 desaturase)